MARFSARLQSDVDRFHERVMTDPVQVVDPEGVQHHEFVSKKHGRKLDYDKILTGTDMFMEWMGVYGRAVLELYPGRKPDAFVGIAGGANRIAIALEGLTGGAVMGLTTEKISDGEVRLDERSLEIIRSGIVRYALTVEDVGTTGGTTMTAVIDLRENGVKRIESLNGHQRNATLPKLDAARIPYEAVILDTSLPTFAPEDCRNLPEGYCHQGITLIERPAT